MQTVHELKQLEVTQTPLFLFECRLRNGEVERWSTHQLTVGGLTYAARVLGHNAFDLRASFDEGLDAGNKLSLRMANADSHFSQIERSLGFKGAQLTVRFVFFDFVAGEAASEVRVMFKGVANPPEEITETQCRLSFGSRLSYQRILLPEVRIQKRCPWAFPVNATQRELALSGGDKGRYSPFHRCGYSAGLPGGSGNLDSSGQHFVSCNYTRAHCEERGMFEQGRFGGNGFVPASVLVRSYGEKGSHLSPVSENEARYNDVVPLVYGTAWYQPPVIFARNDGNLTRMQVLLGMGEIEGPVKVLVNEAEIPEGVSGSNMTATGWYNLVSRGDRNGTVDPEFPGGEPHGGMAVLSVVVPNRINDGKSLPKVSVLIRGLRLSRFDAIGTYVDDAFTNNPAWVLLDVLRRSGWALGELDLASFWRAAFFCSEPVAVKDLNGNSTTVPRYQCNLVLRKRRSAADVIRGIRNGSGLFLRYGSGGLLQLMVEHQIAEQQPSQPEGSNSVQVLAGGWPVYEFSDGSADFAGILKRANGEPSLRLFSRSSAESPNRFSVEFQDEFNEYQQDSLSLVDVDDAIATEQEVGGQLMVLGLPNFDQAARIMKLQLDKSVRGNTYVEFETSVRGFGIAPGDLITLTYLKEGFERQPFRVIRVSPGLNFRTCQITAQIHSDVWYTIGGEGGQGGRRNGANGLGIPRPLVGDEASPDGEPQFSVVERVRFGADGGSTVALQVGFVPPSKPGLSKASIPLVGLSPNVEVSGGTLRGGRTVYYAVSGVDNEGNESQLSFSVPARIPAGSNTNVVTLSGLSFSASTVSFRVYRGPNPTEFRRIASGVALSSTFVDDGSASVELAGPPDEHFDHANFYWRLERVPEASATLFGIASIGATGLGMAMNEHRGAAVRITAGKGAGQERVVVANTETELTVARNWDVVPDATSKFAVSDSAWKFAALTAVSPVEFEAPNRTLAVVQLSGRAANVLDAEAPYELSPLRRWTIGSGGQEGDRDVPAIPVFGLGTIGDGRIELGAIGFATLENTNTISAATLTLWNWDELNPGARRQLAAEISGSGETIGLTSAGSAEKFQLLQIGQELMLVEEVLVPGISYRVRRGYAGTTAELHEAGASVFELQKEVQILPFVRGFFGTPASGSYATRLSMPNVRVCAAELFVTNAFGDSETARIDLSGNTTSGLRTMSGGQISLQVDGYLAIQTNATPPLIVDRKYSIRDVRAVVRDAVVGGVVTIRLKQDGVEICRLAIPNGETESDVLDGQGLAILEAGGSLTLDILAVPQVVNSFPGRDLTVAIRL
jgi:hypothetical protein